MQTVATNLTEVQQTSVLIAEVSHCDYLSQQCI